MTLAPMVPCVGCGRPNPASHAYCDVCGVNLNAPAAPVPVPVRTLGQSASTGILREADALSSQPLSYEIVDRPSSVETVETVSSPGMPAPSPPEARPSRPSRFSARQAQTFTVAGLALAAASELLLQFAPAATLPKIAGLVGLTAASVLFGLGAVDRFLPAIWNHPAMPRFSPRAVFERDTERIAAGVGALTFVALLLRLWYGSVAPTDLLLWAVALLTVGLAFGGERKPAWSLRPYLKEIGAVALLTLLFVGLIAQDVNNWYYSAIGDEYAFMSAAVLLLVEGFRRPFAQDGVYGAHPVLGVTFQALVMSVFGRNHAGWILASVLSAALAIPAMYLLGRNLGGRAVGLLAAALFASSHYLFAFAHLGYNYVMAQTPVVWALALFVLGIRRQNALLLYGAGLATGLSFYAFFSARSIVLILGLIVLAHHGVRGFLRPRSLRDRCLELWPLLVGFVLAAAPIFAASGTAALTRMFNEVPGVFTSAITRPPSQKIAANLWLNVPAYVTGTQWSHYTSGSLLEPVTAVLAILGFGLAVRWRSSFAARLALIWALVAIGVSALLSPYPVVPITRMLFGVPPLALLAALAAVHAWTYLPGRATDHRRVWAGYGAIAALLLIVLALNLYRFWVTTPSKMHLPQEAVVIRALRTPVCGPDMTQTVVVMRQFELLRLALLSYGPQNTLPRMIPHDELRPNQPVALDGLRCAVFGDPSDDVAKLQLEALRRAHPGSKIVQVTDLAGIGTVTVFQPPEAPR
jgi:hypothetical protein